MTDPLPRAELARLLREAIKRSRLTTAAFARDVLFRDERSVRRWSAGAVAMPREVADRLQDGSLLARFEEPPQWGIKNAIV